MEIGKLVSANPWWAAGRVSEVLRGRPRHHYDLVVRSVEVREVTILTGVRRSGKSTLMYQMVDALLSKGMAPEQILFVNLEDKKLFEDSLEDIYAAYRQNINPEKKAFVFLDEIHKRSGWEQWIRQQYDLHDDCKFVISGSCAYLLKKEYSTLLTGRNLTFEVFPLSFREFSSFKGLETDSSSLKKGIIPEKDAHRFMNYLNEYFRNGGFPGVFLENPDFKTKLLEQYFDDILYKDVIDRYELNAQKAKDLAVYLITNFTGRVSLRNIRNSLGLAYESIKDYLSHYKEAFLFFTIDHFAYSMKEQKTNPSKIYCIDNGLRNAVSFQFSKDEGKLAENTVFIELKRTEKSIYYWTQKKEVDFIIKHNDQTLTAINVSYSDEIPERETGSLQEFRQQFPATQKLTLITKNTEKTENGIQFIPLWKWLLEH